ncbi:MAG: AMP-binding protein [Bacteroidaceae bacterium]|nr:AMP-binding protein [Bacteroidaceae bacterium]
MKHFLTYFEDVTRQYWHLPALSNLHGLTYSYADIAENICKLHILFRKTGVKPGDKIALVGRNTSQWGNIFLAISTYHAVAVPLLPNFTADSITRLTAHSDSVILFIDKKILNSGVTPEDIPGLRLVVETDNYTPLYFSSSEYELTMEDIDAEFRKTYPNGLTPDLIHFASDEEEELAIISYTSGTTGNPKGIMLPARSISANIDFSQRTLPSSPRNRCLSMLPLAHMFGFIVEFLYPLLGGCHIFFLDKAPTPSVLLRAFNEVRPYLFVTVPLVMEKLIKGKVMPLLDRPAVKYLTKIPLIDKLIYRKIHKKIMKAFGGNVVLIPMGGAALSRPVEKLLHKIGLPFTVGYGMTECGPLVAYVDWKDFVQTSCGRVVDTLKVRIDTSDQQHEIGEIQVSGPNVMLGYYKDPESTKSAFTHDGWLRTGDLGIIDKNGNIFIKGRCKCMILTSNGQNIYPEEIESLINDLPHVAESLVINREKQLIALISLSEQDKDITDSQADSLCKEVQSNINAVLPKYSHIAKVEIIREGFKHTPKHSIKRGLYS